MQQQTSARQNYLQAEVHTATPQKLQLLLVEAAIKNIYRTKQAWKELKFDEGFETLTRAQDIVAEILCSLDIEGNPEIAKKLASIYIFIFRRLAEGGMNHNEEKLDDAIRVLNSERETWRQVCDKFGVTVGSSTPGATPGGGSVSYTPSSPSSPVSSTTKVLVPPSPNVPASATFARPTGANAFAFSAKPLGASAIKTDSSLAGAKPLGATPLAEQGAKPPQSGYYTAGTKLGNLANLSTSTTAPKKTESSEKTGNGWDA